MDVLADGVALGERGDDGSTEVLRVRAREADPLDALDVVARTQELAELRSDRGSEVAAPRVDVLAEQSDLFDVLTGERRHLRDDLARPAALLAPADGRDDAVGALRVAAHRDLHPRLVTSLAMGRELGREVLVRAEPPARHRIAACRDPLAEVRNRSRPERDVDERVLLEDALALRLRVAPADGDDEVRPLALPCGRVAEMSGEPRIRLLANRARVEDDHVGILDAHRFAETERLEHALDALGIVSVHLAPEGRHVVTAHGQPV